MAADQRARVSLCMIVRNEAHQLEDCLRPVAALFDEIVIVDTGSQDGTKEVAARFTSQVYDFPWCDDFSAARNESLRRARGDCVFWLDADDRLEAADRQRLAALLAGLNGRRQAYLMDTLCTPRFDCDGASLISHVRLFRREAQVGWTGRVHEQLAPALTALGYELIASDVRVQHLGYRDAADQQRKLQRDLRLLRMDYAVNPDCPSTLVHLGLAYFQLGKRDEARRHFRRLIANGNVPHDYLRQVYAALATMSVDEGQLGAALDLLIQATVLFPDDEHLLFLQANILYDLDRYEEAQQVLLRILTSGSRWRYRGGVPSDIKEKLAPRKLGDVLRLRGLYTLAESQHRTVLSRFPEDTVTWHLLGSVYVDWRRKDDLFAVVERIRTCPQGAVFAELLSAMWHLAHQEWAAAELLVDRAVHLAPQMPFARMLRAHCLAGRAAPLAAQVQAHRDILRVQPGNIASANWLARVATFQPAGAATAPGDLHAAIAAKPSATDGISLA